MMNRRDLLRTSCALPFVGLIPAASPIIGATGWEYAVIVDNGNDHVCGYDSDQHKQLWWQIELKRADGSEDRHFIPQASVSTKQIVALARTPADAYSILGLSERTKRRP